ncbi:hypothetical protein, partial [Klebsiella pneumoniae]|uniref:hypothetical protein n=1 Tax=Klebsiella pneumoniae TaxID=573 RepID=UPI001C8F97D3
MTKRHSRCVALQKANGDVAVEPQEKAEVLADSMEAQFSTGPHEIPECSEYVETFVHRHLNMPTTDSPAFLTPGGIAKIIRKLNVKKAAGDDKIGNAALKRLPVRGIVYLTKIFNGIIQTKRF